MDVKEYVEVKLMEAYKSLAEARFTKDIKSAYDSSFAAMQLMIMAKEKRDYRGHGPVVEHFRRDFADDSSIDKRFPVYLDELYDRQDNDVPEDEIGKYLAYSEEIYELTRSYVNEHPLFAKLNIDIDECETKVAMGIGDSLFLSGLMDFCDDRLVELYSIYLSLGKRLVLDMDDDVIRDFVEYLDEEYKLNMSEYAKLKNTEKENDSEISSALFDTLDALEEMFDMDIKYKYNKVVLRGKAVAENAAWIIDRVR